MGDTSFEPQRWRTHRKIWTAVIGVVLIAFIAATYRVKESKALHFDKVKASRRGTIRTAKKKKQTLIFRQQRIGVSRNVWIQDPDGSRRQFFLEAESAEVATPVTPSSTPFTEFFFKPKGWLQEELFWEVSTTGDRVVRRGNLWVKDSPPHSTIPERLYRNVVPVQRVRFFDAATAQWDPATNKLVAETAFFSVLKVPGHDLPSDRHAGQVIAQGTASSITFLFDKKGRQQVSCQGAKLHLNQGAIK
jgi:hypothetical protein